MVLENEVWGKRWPLAVRGPEGSSQDLGSSTREPGERQLWEAGSAVAGSPSPRGWQRVNPAGPCWQHPQPVLPVPPPRHV